MNLRLESRLAVLRTVLVKKGCMPIKTRGAASVKLTFFSVALLGRRGLFTCPEQARRKILQIAAPSLPFVIGARRLVKHVCCTRTESESLRRSERSGQDFRQGKYIDKIDIKNAIYSTCDSLVQSVM